ncbi:unnamed protein product [Calypogeia fissa]
MVRITTFDRLPLRHVTPVDVSITLRLFPLYEQFWLVCLGRGGEADSASVSQQSQQQLDDDQWLYEFASEQSERSFDCGDRYSTLHRWIQTRANLQRLSESPISTKRLNGNEVKERKARKPMRESEEARSEDEREIGTSVSQPSAGLEISQRCTKSSLKTDLKTPEESVLYSFMQYE